MELLLELLQFLFYSCFIVLISKYSLVPLLRKLGMTLDLKPKTIGTISGIATSVPELLSTSFAAASGLITTSWYNILSSNIINLLQYIFSIFLHKNQRFLSNLALKIDLILVMITIVIPFLILAFSVSITIAMIPIFLLLFLLFSFINRNTHTLYLFSSKSFEEQEIENDKRWLKGKKKKTVLYTILLLLTTILLFFIGNLLSHSLESLCLYFSVPEFILGIALGFITSLPELITFFEAQKHHKKQSQIKEGVIEATNNLLTSNMMNLFIIQSIALFLVTFS